MLKSFWVYPLRRSYWNGWISISRKQATRRQLRTFLLIWRYFRHSYCISEHVSSSVIIISREYVVVGYVSVSHIGIYIIATYWIIYMDVNWILGARWEILSAMLDIIPILVQSMKAYRDLKLIDIQNTGEQRIRSTSAEFNGSVSGLKLYLPLLSFIPMGTGSSLLDTAA